MAGYADVPTPGQLAPITRSSYPAHDQRARPSVLYRLLCVRATHVSVSFRRRIRLIRPVVIQVTELAGAQCARSEIDSTDRVSVQRFRPADWQWIAAISPRSSAVLNAISCLLTQPAEGPAEPMYPSATTCESHHRTQAAGNPAVDQAVRSTAVLRGTWRPARW